MSGDILNFNLPSGGGSIITVLGVGGGGCNAVNHMHNQGIKDVEFVVSNTDAQALLNSPVQNKIQLGPSLTEGLGAGNKPEIGKQAAIESIGELKTLLEQNTKMVFITAGFGGGTGTGAAPVIAQAAREMGILTVAIVTIPFHFEGETKIEQAIKGIELMQYQADSILIINNEKLREMYGNLPISEAFTEADKILTIAAKGIAEIITLSGYINVDFADVDTVMRNSGVAIMGSGQGAGKNRAQKAITQALNSPLLNNSDINGAENILLNLCSGKDEIRMDEVGEVTDYVQKNVGVDTNLIWGSGVDVSLGDKISVTIIATGFNKTSMPEIFGKYEEDKIVKVLLNDKPEDNLSPDETQTVIKTEKIIKKEGIIDLEVNHSKPEKNNGGKINTQEPKQQIEELDLVPNNQDGEENLVNNLNFDSGSVQKSRMKKINNERHKQLSLHEICDPDEVDKIEKQPAFKRKKVNISDKKPSEESNISRFSLAETKEKEFTIKKDNDYLHDPPD